MSEILQNTGAKLWDNKDDYSLIWLDIFDIIAGTSGKSDIRLIDEAIGRINTALNGYHFTYENDRLYICKDGDGSTTKLPISLVDSNGNIASSVDGTTITIDENGVIHGAADIAIDDAFSLTSTNSLQNKVITEKFDEVGGKISANETAILSHTSALEILNGTGEGSVKKIAEDAAVAEVTKVIADAPESLDTLKEISDWISGHENDAAAMNSAIKVNADNITDLQTNKADSSDLTLHTTNTDVHVTTDEKTLWNTVSSKVDKETGKGLSTNDYTTDEKTKLSGLDDTLLNKLGESTEGTLTFNGSEIKTNTDYVADTLAEAQAAIESGLIEEGASVYVKEDSGSSGGIIIDSELSDTSENPVQNKVIKNYVDSHTDVLVMSDEGVHGLRYKDEKLEAMDFNGEWHEIQTGGGGTTVNIGDVSGASVTAYSRKVALLWSDPEDVILSGVTFAKWGGTLVVRKEGSAPTSKVDGIVVVDNKEKNKYSSVPLVDDGLENGKTYYYRFFPYTDGKKYTDGSSVNATPQRQVITIIPSQSGILTYNKSSQSPIWSDYDSSKMTLGGTTSGINAGSYTASFTPNDDYMWSDGTTIAKNITWNIDKANGFVILSATSVILNSSTRFKTITVSDATGTVTVSSDNTSIATTSISENTITINSVNDTEGNATVTVNVAESTNYNSYNTSITVSTQFLKIVTFANGTDAEIVAMLEAHYNNKINISDYWAVGDTRSVSLSAMSATGVGESHRAQTVQFAIAGFDHDVLTTPINGHTKAAITLTQVHCLMDSANESNPTNGAGNTENGYMNSSITNRGGWEKCARRKWCNDVYYNVLPASIKKAVKEVNKLTSIGNDSDTINTTSDKVFLLSEIEIFGATGHSFTGEGEWYAYYKNSTANKYKMPKLNSSYVSNVWFVRSPNSGDANSFCNVSATGGGGCSQANVARGIAPCLCL